MFGSIKCEFNFQEKENDKLERRRAIAFRYFYAKEVWDQVNIRKSLISRYIAKGEIFVEDLAFYLQIS